MAKLTKRGDGAKNTAFKKIQEAFGEDYIGVRDKKIYVYAVDYPNNEKLQVAITLTLPKITITADEVEKGAEVGAVAEPTFELSEADKKKVEELKKILGI